MICFSPDMIAMMTAAQARQDEEMQGTMPPEEVMICRDHSASNCLANYSVLEKGYVRLESVYGSDLEVANDARVSYEKKAKGEMSKGDQRIIEFLGKADPKHESPFRGIAMKFEIRAPLFVARQWWRYVVSSWHAEELHNWNEASRRYVTDETEFYVPYQFRAAPENKKQGSNGLADELTSSSFKAMLIAVQQDGAALYEKAMECGIAPEQARLFLPAYGLYVRWRWLASFQSVCHFIRQRLEHTAQWEIQQFAQAVDRMTREQFPVAYDAFMYDERHELRAEISDLKAKLAKLENP